MQSLFEPGFWALEFTLVSVLLLGAYHLRPRLGLSAVVAVVVSFQFLQAILGASFYWEITDGVLITPGSAILYASNMALLLYAFARDGIATARIILYAIIIGNVVPHLMGALFWAHIEFSEPHNFLDIPTSLFYQGLFSALIGISVLYLMQVGALLGFSWLRRRMASLPVALPLSMTLMVVLALDTVLYLTIVHADHDALSTMLFSGIAAKSMGGLAFGIVWGAYLQNHLGKDLDDLREILRFIFFRDDITELRKAATRDPLTDLFNRRTFQRIVDQLLEREQDHFTVILCDVDRFKQVNDNLGHQIGDQVLVDIADHLQQSVREMDFAFRIGGDEFAVLLPRCDRERAQDVAQRLSEFQFRHADLDTPVTLTMGTATFPSDGDHLEQLYQCADTRLYRGKESGRDAVVTSD